MKLVYNFEVINESLDLVGLSRETRIAVYKILAVILNMGNIQIAETESGCLSVSSTSEKFLDNVATLANIPKIELQESLLTRTIKDAGANGTKIRLTFSIF